MGCSASAPTPAGQIHASAPPTPKPATNPDASFFKMYTLGHKLGKGGFAQVREASCKKTGSVVAVKIQDLRDESTGGCNATFRRYAVEEGVAWREAGQHRNIVVLRDAFLEHGVCFFAMEVCDTSFEKYLKRGAGEAYLTERSIARVMDQVLTGVAHLHGRSVVHRDIKPDNFMVHGDTVKLCDFGLAIVLPNKGQLSGVYGTAPFMAPEMLKNQEYRQEVDVWSVGVLAYVLLYGNFPVVPQIKTSSEMKKVIRDGSMVPAYIPQARGPAPVPTISRPAESLVRVLLNRDQDTRISAKGAAGFSWIVKHRSEQSSEASLQDLGPVLASALRCGAFEHRPVDVADGTLDALLHRLHKRHEKCVLQDARPKPKMDGPEWAQPEAMWKAPSDASTVSTASGVSSKISSVPSTAVPNWQTSQVHPGQHGLAGAGQLSARQPRRHSK